MDTTRVNKTELLETLRANRAAHRANFEEALDAYRDRVVGWLEQRLDAARRGERVEMAFQSPIPEDFTREYDRAIRMLEMSLDDEIEISSRDFDQLVMDNWSWTPRFAANTMSYLAVEGDQ